MNDIKIRPESPLSPDYAKRLTAYVQTDLRRRFDDTRDNLKAIEIIEEAIDFGFTELADQMINDGCVEDDFKSFWNRRKAQIYREMAEGDDPTEREMKSFSGHRQSVEL